MKMWLWATSRWWSSKLPLDQRPPIATEGPAVGKGVRIPVCGYVDPGAAHSVIRRDVVEHAKARIFEDPRAAAMQGFGKGREMPAGFCFLVNEVKGKNKNGHERVVRFITMPMVVGETAVKFPYLLGAEITNRIRLHYSDEDTMHTVSYTHLTLPTKRIV